jgi:hypothetical protein
MERHNEHGLGTDAIRMMNRVEVEPAEQHKTGQLNPAVWNLMQPNNWTRWFSGETANKKRKLDEISHVDHEHQEREQVDRNKPVFGAFGGKITPMTFNPSTSNVFERRLTGPHESNVSNVRSKWF